MLECRNVHYSRVKGIAFRGLGFVVCERHLGTAKLSRFTSLFSCVAVVILRKLLYCIYTPYDSLNP